jgi:eukaryotic-like serine/threonine-protein kinase
MTVSQISVLLVSLSAAAAANAQSMFRGDAMHSGQYAGPAPRQFHRVKWKFPTGDRVMSSPVFKDNVIYFGGDDGNVYAVDAVTGRQIWKRATNGPVPATPAIAKGTVYIGSYDGKFYALDAQTGALKWKFTTEGERRFEAKGLHGIATKKPDDRRPV